MNSKSAFFRNDPIALRHLIFYECIDGMPAYRAYQNLCKKIGDDVIDYDEFEFWYMRFARGELDMNYDRSLEPETRSFYDLPVDVHKIIGKELTLADKLIVRNVSKFFKNLFNSWIPDFNQVSMEFDDSSTTLKLDDNELRYHNCMARNLHEVNTIGFNFHWRLAMSHLFIMLKSTKVQLEKLYVRFSTREVTEDKIEDKIAAKFTAMDLKINTPIVEIVTSYSNGEMAILPFLESGALKEIIINANYSGSLRCQERFTRIGQLEQCQQSETLTIKFGRCDPILFPIEGFIDCTHLDLQFGSFRNEENLSIRDMLRFQKVLVRSQRLNYFHLKSNCNFMIDTLKNRLGKAALEVPYRPDIRHFRIPNSDEYFELDLSLSHNRSIDLTIRRMR